ncbi:heparinase II/III family protein [Dietzia sp. PP-33]|uniref:heparinase II/III domain-containing protein n=1 Tax=Dietzia sp. PP-33 TaxID=2957500 RepID=UPI0029A165CA|nr:heparinase II/III family protein [Dietzia sp. PP-33]MDX2358771.1 heparinase II/III family protein [Dietzia sp. PP-33]
MVDSLWPETTPWWQIDIRTDQRLSDVKFVWEAGRHRDLVVLARAAVLDPDGVWMNHLIEMLERWVAECRPERGVNWYSSLELALRAIAWAQVIALVGDGIAETLRGQLDHQLMASARHIFVELPYTVSSMKNNHLLGDGLGLVVLGMMFPEQGKRWRRIGDRLMLAQLRRHMHSDGSMIEDSLSYHRFVLEMLAVRQLLGGAPVEIERALEGAGLHLVRLGVFDGPVPQFGDWDEGRVLADSASAGSTAGSAWAALALSGYEVPAERFDEYDELAWYVTSKGDGHELPRRERDWVRAGDFIRADSDDRRIWFKTGSGQSHQHADVSSVWILEKGRWLVQDPGTGTYNGPLQIRNGFRTSAAHPVWVPVGEDQLQPHRAFRWLRSVSATGSYAVHVGDCTAFLSVHNAFAKTHGRVARVILVASSGVTVVDAVEYPGGSWTMTLPLGNSAIQDEFFGLGEIAPHVGEESPWRGWRSPTYGTWERSTWLEVACTFDETKRWGIGEPSAVNVEFRWNAGFVEAHLNTGTESVQLTVRGAS